MSNDLPLFMEKGYTTCRIFLNNRHRRVLACMYTRGFIGSIADKVSQSQTPVDGLGCLMEGSNHELGFQRSEHNI
jgi:hypothetical protein